MCSTLASTASYPVTDTRDGQVYTVRYINGNCWMTQNLRLGYNSSNPNTTTIGLTPQDSNVTQNRSITAYNLVTYGGSNCDTANSYNNSCVHSGTIAAANTYAGVDQDTVWYNYATATAGTITGTSNSVTATESVCPKGWGLPNVTRFRTIADNTDTFVAAFSPVKGGLYSNGVIGRSGEGMWWTVTMASTTARYYSYFNNSKLGTNVAFRPTSIYVRCASVQ